MLNVIKKTGKAIKAYKLGDNSEVISQMISEGKIKQINEQEYEIFSQEAVRGESGHGQLAKRGDYIKIDSNGYPYPNDASYFSQNHRYIKDDSYEQLPKPLNAWKSDMPLCKEVQFLQDNKGLILNPDNPDKYFNALLWGTQESADKDAWLIFYDIAYDDAGNVTDASFNFVTDSEFQKTYNVLSEEI